MVSILKTIAGPPISQILIEFSEFIACASVDDDECIFIIAEDTQDRV
jgi:hypothetical protein